MAFVALLLLVGAGVARAPSTASAASAPAWVRDYVATYSATSATTTAGAIPAWGRKYNMACSGCHYPAPPRLNAVGLRFRWAGYRMPEEIGEKVDVERVQNYLAAGGELEYAYDKVEGAPASNSFAAPAVVVFYAGPAGRSFSGFLELENGPGEVERIAHVSTIWGSEKGYGGFRFGQMHNLYEWGVAGFDRPTGISVPSPIADPLTAAIPFMVAEHALGLEAYYVRGSNRLSAQVLNGITADGEVAAEDEDSKKDFLVTDQYLLDEAGSGVQAFGYFGTLVGVDAATAPELKSRFWRLGASANKIYQDFELLGGVLAGKDLDLPASLAFAGNENRGLGWWVSGQYNIKKLPLVLLARYEFLDPDTKTADDANRRLVAGAVLPLNVPQYLRWSLEFRLDTPQGGGPKTTNVTTNFRLFF